MSDWSQDSHPLFQLLPAGVNGLSGAVGSMLRRLHVPQLEEDVGTLQDAAAAAASAAVLPRRYR